MSPTSPACRGPLLQSYPTLRRSQSEPRPQPRLSGASTSTMVLQPFANSLRLAGLLIDNPSVLDMDDAVRKGQQTRIMRHDQHGVSAFPGDFGKYLHDRLAILAIECGGRLVGKNDGRIADNGPGDRDALLLAA